MPSTPPPAESQNAIRAYLAEIGMAPILEEFVAETVADRPNDIFAFMETFARRKRQEAQQDNQWTMVKSWASFAAKTEAALQQFADSFFDMLFITQRTMKRTVFASIVDGGDLAASALTLAKVFDRAVRGELSDYDLAALAAKYTAEIPIESYHYQALTSTLLLAIRNTMPAEVWDAVTDDWRQFCMDNAVRLEGAISDAKAAAGAAAEGGEENTKSGQQKKEGEPTLTALEMWEKMPLATQQSIVRSAFDVLFTQHGHVKRNFFSDVDIEGLVVSLHPLLEKLIKGTLTDEDIVATGLIATAVEKGAQYYHIQYAVTALLMAVSMSLGRAQWGEEIAEAWRAKIFAVGDKIITMLNVALEEKEKKKVPQNQINEEEL